jgi:hypothetical protein
MGVCDRTPPALSGIDEEDGKKTEKLRLSTQHHTSVVLRHNAPHESSSVQGGALLAFLRSSPSLPLDWLVALPHANVVVDFLSAHTAKKQQTTQSL